jgi:hypothetical protein
VKDLSYIDANKLKVYKNAEAYESNNQALKPSASLNGLGKEEDALYVVAPFRNTHHFALIRQ